MRKPIIIIIILLVLAIGAIFYTSMQRNTSIIVVEVTLAQPPDNNIEYIISNVNASLSNVTNMDVPKETSLISPGITVVLIQNMQIQSGWYSVGIPDGIYGNYTIKVKPYNDFNTSRPFFINSRVLLDGKDVSVKLTEHKVP